MRKFGTYFFAFFFSIVLSLFALFFVLNSTILNGERVKGYLENADTVNLIVKNAAYLAEFEEGGNVDINLTDEEKADIGETLKDPVGQNLLKPQVISLVDQFYDWIGTKPYTEPSFSIDLSGNKKEVKATLNSLVETFVNKLPVCEGSGGGEDEFCVPPEAENDRTKFLSEIQADIYEGISTGDEPILGVQEFDFSKETLETFETVHQSHRAFKTAFLALFISVLTFAGLVELVSTNRLYALKTLSRFVMGSLFVPVLLSLGVILFLPEKFDVTLGDDFGMSANAAAGRIASPLINEIARGFAKSYLILGLPLLMSSIAGMIFIHKKHEEKNPSKQPK